MEKKAMGLIRRYHIKLTHFEKEIFYILAILKVLVGV